MIKIDKEGCPKELTPDVVSKLTQEFISTRKAVWKQPYLTEALARSSKNKCVYCECTLGIESNYLEVEHFHHKSDYPKEVVVWDNLLPSCGRCNGHKGIFDTLHNPFVNPAEMSPKEHMILDSYFLRPITIAGFNTIEEVNLNDINRLVTARFEVCKVTLNSIETIYQHILSYKEKATTRRLNMIASNTKALLKEGLDHSEYSASVSTLIINNGTFLTIKEFLRIHSKWDAELENGFKILEKNAFSTDITLFYDFFLPQI